MTSKEESASVSTLKIPITLAYAPSPMVMLYDSLTVPVGTQILTALVQVGWLDSDDELAQWCQYHKSDTQINPKHWRVGVFSTKKLLTYSLQPHDRVEVYRSLTIEPMHKRKKRAAQH